MLQMCLLNVLIFISLNLSDIESSTLTHGSQCETPNGELATCVHLLECARFLNIIHLRTNSSYHFIQKSQCGYDTEPLVCCGSSINFITSRENDPDHNTNTNNSVKRTRSKTRICGFQESDKETGAFIFGGNETQINEFPWMALLGYTDEQGKILWLCGGTVISSYHILTAAHCISDSKKSGTLTHVRLGEHNIATNIDCNENNKCNLGPIDMKVAEVTVHPEYVPFDFYRYHDIALIKVNQSIHFNEFMRPICLPRSGQASKHGDLLTTAGWGKTPTNGESSIKLKVEVPLVDHRVCKRFYRNEGIFLTDSQICAGGEEGEDSCLGDSGGPLMKRSSSNRFQWYQEGIVSFGYANCGTKGAPGVYIKVKDYLPWMREVILH